MASDLDGQLADVAAALRAITVRVTDEGRRGAGSGVVWTAHGSIVTNAHVVRGAAAEIAWEDGRTARGAVVRRDDARDLAEIRIAGEHDLAAAPVRASATLGVGELVVAVGNPLGLIGAMTAGLVQRCNARWVVADVRLAPGNSGGPLADVAGRVVGINSMVADGRGYAVPSDAVAAFLGAGEARRRLGIAFAPAVASVGGRRTLAFIVTAVETASVAERAGLLFGDAIVAADNAAVANVDDPAATLVRARALTVLRAGRRVTIALGWDALGDTRAA